MGDCGGVFQEDWLGVSPKGGRGLGSHLPALRGPDVGRLHRMWSTCWSPPCLRLGQSAGQGPPRARSQGTDLSGPPAFAAVPWRGPSLMALPLHSPDGLSHMDTP